VVYYAEQALFLPLEELFLFFFLFFFFLDGHVALALVLNLEVLFNFLHLLRSRVELESNDPRRPLGADPVDEPDGAAEDDVGQRLFEIVPQRSISNSVEDARDGDESD